MCHDAVAGMLDLASAMCVEPAPDQSVVRPHQFERRGVAKARRHLGRTDDVGEHDGAQPGIHGRRRSPRGGARIADAAEKGLNRGKIDRNDGVGDFAMRLTMDSLGGGRVGRMYETEGGATLLVEPIGHVFYPVPVLDVDIPAVRRGDILRVRSAQVVAVHEDRHAVLPSVAAMAQSAGRMFWFTRKRLLGSYFFFSAARRS